MSDAPLSVETHLAALPPDRREQVVQVRRVILDHLRQGYEETVRAGMLLYEVPLVRYPRTYNGQPLVYAALASQKRYLSLYLMALYAGGDAAAFEREYRATGKRYDVGKSCVRFRTVDDLPLDLVARVIASMTVDEYIAAAEAARQR